MTDGCGIPEQDVRKLIRALEGVKGFCERMLGNTRHSLEHLRALPAAEHHGAFGVRWFGYESQEQAMGMLRGGYFSRVVATEKDWRHNGNGPLALPLPFLVVEFVVIVGISVAVLGSISYCATASRDFSGCERKNYLVKVEP